jgi:predicted flap endonuclease-1-like 5' DNA nuclease
MLTLITCNIIPLLIAALIGLLTGWWAWANRVRVSLAADTAPAPTLARSPMPAAAPVCSAEPVAFAEPIVAAPPPPAPAPPPVPVAAPPAPPKPAPVMAPVAAAMTAIGIPAAIGKADDLMQLKGVGPKLNTLLNSLGVSRFDQIAAWAAKEIGIVDGHLGSFKGRIVRDEWVEQADLLANRKIAAFEAKYGKLDSEN